MGMNTRWAMGPMVALVAGCALLGGARPATDGSTPKGAATASNQFGIDLYLRARRSAANENLVVSPLSAALALSMTAAGARGRTQAEMLATLHLDREHFADSHTSFATLMADLNARGKQSGLTLRVIDGLFGQTETRFGRDFVALTRDHYSAALERLDFVRAPDEASASINEWARRETHGQVRDIISPDAIKPGTRLILANALYLKAHWIKVFPKSQTRQQTFHAVGGPIDVPMMEDERDLSCARVGNVEVAELAYERGLSMLIVLPDHGLDEVETALAGGQYERWIGALTDARRSVELPRWHAHSRVPLTPLLEELGMRTAFADSADFGAMIEDGMLRISDVVQAAVVDVDEAGTEASAVTTITMTDESYEPPPPLFRVDRPFLYGIRDRVSGAILFIGQVTNPA